MEKYIIFLYSALAILGITSGREYQREIQPYSRTGWGGWGEVQFCPGNSFAEAFRLKVEGHQGSGYGQDDTALNAIQLRCSNGYPIESSQGPWGYWRSWQSCSSGYLNSAELRSESSQGGGNYGGSDDTAANDVNMGCTNSRPLPGGGGTWGEWSSMVYCPSGAAICGIQTRVEGHQGRGDDTALNSVAFYCCPV